MPAEDTKKTRIERHSHPTEDIEKNENGEAFVKFQTKLMQLTMMFVQFRVSPTNTPDIYLSE